MRATFDPQNPSIETAPSHLETPRLRIRNVMLATDFPAGAHAALRAAAALTKQFDSTLFILHVVPPVIVYAREEVGMLDPTMLEANITVAKSHMDALTRDPALQFINHREILVSTPIIASIEDAVAEYKIDLLVMGTHGASGLEKLMLGSVAEAVLRSSSCPVMVVGPHCAPHGFRNGSVLLATKFGVGSLRPAQYAVSIAEEVAGKIALIHVADETGEASHEARELLKRKIAAQLRQLLPLDAELWCTPNLRVEFGEASAAILQAARLERADLIVVGVRDGALFGDHASWSTVSKIIRGAACPVLAVRAHAA
jgi:nucleotide-binding universal stress UspA family protein